MINPLEQAIKASPKCPVCGHGSISHKAAGCVALVGGDRCGCPGVK